MKVNVHMLAFGKPGEIREVDIPDDEPGDVRELVYKYGQNNYQSRPHPSVSVGDVIEYNGFWLVKPTGFKEMTADEFDKYVAMDRRNERWFVAHSD